VTQDRTRLLLAVGAVPLTIVLCTLVEMDLTMAIVLAGLVGVRLAADDRRVITAVIIGLVAWAIVMPFFHGEAGGFIDTAVLAAGYAVMALGLNIIVGFAGLLDLGYVAFYALGALTAGYFMAASLPSCPACT
jgi:hypothetical protein